MFRWYLFLRTVRAIGGETGEKTFSNVIRYSDELGYDSSYRVPGDITFLVVCRHELQPTEPTAEFRGSGSLATKGC